MDQHSAERHPALANIQIGAGEAVAYRGDTAVHALEREQPRIGSSDRRAGDGGEGQAKGCQKDKRLKHLNDLAAQARACNERGTALELRTARIELSTGIGLNVCLGGEGEPVIFLHGFPESHRTWRHQLADLSSDHLVVAPDQRGFATSDKPKRVDDYQTEKIVADLMALADALDIKHFTLVGHDWGGAVAWLAALTHPFRVKRLVIVNAPHPLIFQKSMVEEEEQRAASQYIRALRRPLIHVAIKAMGLERFFDRVVAGHADTARLPPEERRRYIEDWSRPGALRAMTNWYKASKIQVPKMGEKAKAPLWTHAPFPSLSMPVLVIWGMKDTALLPVQLEGLDKLVDDLRIVKVPDASHFVTWERPEAVTAAIRDFLAETGG
jgi:pimeloyl-ACP methyl ester carboxylesterase